MDERQFRQFTCRYAINAFRLRFRHWVHDGLSLWYLQENARERRDQEGMDWENILLFSWSGIPEHDLDHHCCDRKSLLDGRLNGYDRGCRCILVQRHIFDTAAYRGSTAMGPEVGKANPEYRRKIQAEGWPLVRQTRISSRV